jgi:hypothetical protein
LLLRIIVTIIVTIILVKGNKEKDDDVGLIKRIYVHCSCIYSRTRINA